MIPSGPPRITLIAPPAELLGLGGRLLGTRMCVGLLSPEGDDVSWVARTLLGEAVMCGAAPPFAGPPERVLPAAAVVVLGGDPPREGDGARPAAALRQAERAGDLIRCHSEGTTVLVASEPQEIVARLVARRAGLAPGRVLAPGAFIDARRLAEIAARRLDVCLDDVTVTVLGGRGPHGVVPLRLCRVAGIPLPDVVDAEELERLWRPSRMVVATDRFALHSWVIRVARAILGQRREVLLGAMELRGEWGIHDAFVTALLRLGAGSCQGIVAPRLTDEEMAGVRHAAHVHRELARSCNA